MKTNKILLIILTAAILASASLVGCKKAIDNLVNNLDNTYSTEAKAQSSDASAVNLESEQVTNEVLNVAAGSLMIVGAGNVSSGNGAPSDATLVPNVNYPTITINYNGTKIGCKQRKGSVVVSLIGNKLWTDSGAVLNITFDSVKIYNSCNNKTVILVGSKTITNLRKGNLFTLTKTPQDSLIHKVRANYNVVFIDSLGNKKFAQWNVARRTRINFLSTYIFTTYGDTVINTIPSVESWGTTRDGSSFTTSYTTPVISNSSCGVGNPLAGGVSYVVGVFPFIVQYGVDINGNQILPGNCAFFYKVNWVTVAGTNISVILPY